MPTLFRFVSFIIFMIGLAYGSMFALATFVKPKQAEMTIRIPPEKLNPQMVKDAAKAANTPAAAPADAAP